MTGIARLRSDAFESRLLFTLSPAVVVPVVQEPDSPRWKRAGKYQVQWKCWGGAKVFKVHGIRRLLASVMLLALVGCGRGDAPDVASVEGTVTLDGRPLERATVTFQPEGGRPSFGTTDAAGKYRMVYTMDKSGVMLGPNKVYIRTRFEDDNGRVVQQEFLPAKYHDRSELTANVENKPNVIDFALTSK
ncbi:carboxypeptidase-like regulatory domain-containing protein [Planctomicrobium sp. SH664]|uniref:carboxypeptidase-like regulatory domain-containing protein n=1 Tax=Planctomicrobium sp. SH664 TaxID=3448125 RepID=UPI003F5B0B88